MCLNIFFNVFFQGPIIGLWSLWFKASLFAVDQDVCAPFGCWNMWWVGMDIIFWTLFYYELVNSSRFLSSSTLILHSQQLSLITCLSSVMFFYVLFFFCCKVLNFQVSPNSADRIITWLFPFFKSFIGWGNLIWSLSGIIDIGLTGTKLGCGEGGCGACTVMVSRYDKKSKKCVWVSPHFLSLTFYHV